MHNGNLQQNSMLEASDCELAQSRLNLYTVAGEVEFNSKRLNTLVVEELELRGISVSVLESSP